MIEKIKQYKNLILVVVAIVLVTLLIAGDPIGLLTERRHQRALIENQIALEKAETEQKIAIIKAQTDAELLRIQSGLPTVVPVEVEPEPMETETE